MPGIHRSGSLAAARCSSWKLFAGALALWYLCSPAGAQTHGADWPVTTGSKASQRYAALDRIDASNVSRLQRVWTWTSPDAALVAEDPQFKSRRMRPGNHQASPLKIGERLYTTTALYQIAAIDPATGTTVWSYDPNAYSSGRPTNLGFTHRGAAFWTDDRGRLPPRLFYATGDAHLRVVDALGGEPVGDFGDQGAVDLTLGLRREVSRRKYTVSSPVTVCDDVVVVGSSISDVPTHPEAPPGDVRGFDARTGEQLWTFHSIPQPGEHGHETWEDGSWEYTGNANVWTLMSADEELGLVYLPFGTPTNDWYGGHRLGDNLFSESLVAVDCKTGERRWHFQMVHHGLWDYDLPTSAILGDFEVDGRQVKAAMQLSKQGFLYVFDRATGEPVWPIEERPVPQTGIPGERTSATQPFPTKPPPFERQGLSDEDLLDFTPELLAEARRILQSHHYGPLYAPPSEKGTLNLPGWGGGANWPGGAFDPKTGMLYVPSVTSPVSMTLKKPDPSCSSFDYIGSIQLNVRGPAGLPLVKPPYSRLTAYDMNKGDIAWTVPLGDGPVGHPALRELGLEKLGSGARGHVLVTDSLLFVATGQSVFDLPEMEELVLFGENAVGELDAAIEEESGESQATPLPEWNFEPSRLSAYDKATGALLWSTEIAEEIGGSPITYLHEGKQYIVFAIGGQAEPAKLVAYGLP